MKEYQTLRVKPNEETKTLSLMERRGFKLESSREVYNEREEVVGSQTEYKSHNAFMRGFTGNDGNVKTTVQTQIQVTHFIAMTFSRDKDMPNYNEILSVENEIKNIKAPCKAMPESKKPLVGKIVAIAGAVLSFFVGIDMPNDVGNTEYMTYSIILLILGLGIAALGLLLFIKSSKTLKAEREKVKAYNNKVIEERDAKANSLWAKLDCLVNESKKKQAE